MTVLVTGATGFLGRRVVRQLLEHHLPVRCLVHRVGSERIFDGQPLEVYYGGVHDPNALDEAMQGADAVIHLVAIIRQRGRETFDSVNRLGVANVADAAQRNGVKHFIHVSANGATEDSKYKYLHSKFLGEQEVKARNLDYTILRPSLMYGPGDEVFSVLAGLMRALPFMPVAGSGRNRFQPIDVEVVARCLAMSVDRTDLKGRTLEIGGPEQLSYNELLDLVAYTLGKKRLRLHLPVWMMYLSTLAMQVVQPRPALTTEMLGMLSLRNVTEIDAVEKTFGFTPEGMEGNIDYVKSVTARDGLKTALGFGPRRRPQDFP